MTVPNIFANATTAIPLVQLDQNFNTAITLGNTTVFLGNTTTSLGNVTLTGANVTATTLNTTGNTTIFGTATNNSATAGYVGEYVESVVVAGSPVAMATGVGVNVTSISLTAGDWDVSAIAKGATSGSAVISWVRASISSTSATYNDLASFSNESSQTSVNIGAPSFGIPPVRFSLASTTTIYLTLQCAYTPGTVGAYGTLRARRVR